MARRSDRERGEVLSENDLKELRHSLADLSVTAVRNSVVRTSCPLRFFRKHKTRWEGYPAEPANRIYLAITLPFLDASPWPTSLAEQPPSSSVLPMTLCAWGSPLPSGRSAWPIVPFEQG